MIMGHTPRQMNRRSLMMAAAGTLATPLVSALAGPHGAAAAQEASATPAAVTADTSISGTIEVGMVGNPQMVALQEIVVAGEFAKAYPNITVNLTVLPENEIRQTISRDVAAQAGQFDIFTVGPFEVPLWAEQGWLHEVGKEVANDPNYGLDDIFPSMTAGLSYKDGLYALPFYGESAMTFYRKDLFKEAGLTMPERPTWDDISGFAEKLHKPGVVNGLGLRGLPGWGEMGAPLTTMINAFGGRWFDENWHAALTEDTSSEAIHFYIENLQKYGPPGVEQNGFTETETLFVQGQIAQWFDATSAAELLSSTEENPKYADKVGFAYGPSKVLPTGNWLWSWNFAMAANSDQEEASLAFMKWATSREYQKLVVQHDGGWGRTPTGARESTYSDPEYLAFAGDFAEIVRKSIEEANPNKPTKEPVPYTGGQFVRIPEFTQLGDDATQQFAAALVGDKSIDDAIKAANDLANQVAIDGGYQ